MDRYAVLWREAGGSVFAGSLAFGPDGIALDGASRGGSRAAVTVAYAEIQAVTVGRSPGERIDGRSSLVIARQPGEPLLLTSATGIGINHDIAERLAQATGHGSRT